VKLEPGLGVLYTLQRVSLWIYERSHF